MHYTVSILALIETILISCKLLPQLEKLDGKRIDYNLLPKLDYLSQVKEVGILHTLNKYAEWHIKEELLVKHFVFRVKKLKTLNKFTKR